MKTNKKGVLIVGLLLFAAIIATILYQPKSPGSVESGTSSLKKSQNASVHVYQIEGGWAYEILVDSKAFIVQEQIPGIANLKKFNTETDAQKCGQLVLDKLIKHKNPSVSKQELDSLGIVYQ